MKVRVRSQPTTNLSASFPLDTLDWCQQIQISQLQSQAYHPNVQIPKPPNGSVLLWRKPFVFVSMDTPKYLWGGGKINFLDRPPVSFHVRREGTTWASLEPTPPGIASRPPRRQSLESGPRLVRLGGGEGADLQGRHPVRACRPTTNQPTNNQTALYLMHRKPLLCNTVLTCGLKSWRVAGSPPEIAGRWRATRKAPLILATHQ